MTRLALGDGSVRSSVGRARHGLGRAGRFGRPIEDSFRFCAFPAPSSALRATENPRVAGSIPSLDTTSNLSKRMGCRVSPADHPCPSMVHPRTIGKWARETSLRGRGGADEIGNLTVPAAGPHCAQARAADCDLEAQASGRSAKS